MLKKIHAFFHKLDFPDWLVVFLFACLVFRIPTFFEPFYYGDEMIYLTLGQGLKQGLPLYTGLYDNKPPLIYLIAAIAGNITWFKIILAAFSLTAIVLFFKIVRHFAAGKKIVKIATVAFALITTLPLLEGNIANAENFFLTFSLGGIYLLLKNKNSGFFWAGILFSLAFHTKIPAVFDLFGIVLFLIIGGFANRAEFRKKLEKLFFLGLGFLIPLALTCGWYLIQGDLDNYLKTTLFQNFGYISSWRGSPSNLGFLKRNLPLLIRGAIVSGGLILVFLFRKRVSKLFLLGVIWLLFSLFAATLSERPYPHYLLQTTPALAILIGILATSQKIEQVTTFLPLALFAGTVVYFRFWYYPSLSYYLRFFKFASGAISQETYFKSFDAHTVRNYELARFLATSTKAADRVFVWGPDSPAIYALSRKLPPVIFVADYHIFDYFSLEELASELEKNQPKFIILTPEAKPFPQIINLLKKRYLLINTIDNAEIYTRLSLNL